MSLIKLKKKRVTQQTINTAREAFQLQLWLQLCNKTVVFQCLFSVLGVILMKSWKTSNTLILSLDLTLKDIFYISKTLHPSAPAPAPATLRTHCGTRVKEFSHPAPDGWLILPRRQPASFDLRCLNSRQKPPDGTLGERRLAGSKSAAWHRCQPEASTQVTGGFAQEAVRSRDCAAKGH